MRAERGGILGGALIVATIALASSFWPRSLPERSFAPDWTGGGRRVTVDGGRRGFLTRAMSGIAGEAGRGWAERNGLTPPLAFSHHLAAIFPPALHAKHPEFFPLVNGERLRPRDGAQNWNPDLGREDVAAWAADAARRHFAANPESESFSVGINDGLIFGDSAETMAALRRNKPRAGETVVRRKEEESEDRNQRSEPSDLHRTNAEDVQFRSDLFGQEAIRGRSESDLSIRSRSLPFSVCPRVVSCENQTISWFRQRPDLSNLVFGFTNRVARYVARSHPDKYVGALAYYWCENAPGFPVEPNVIPFLTADRSQGYDEAFRAEELALQQRWADATWTPETRNLKSEAGTRRAALQAQPPAERDAGEWGSQVSGFSLPLSAGAPRRLGLYDYLYGSGFLIPRIPTRLIADNLRQARRLGFTDYYAEVNPNGGLDGPMPWLVAQLLLDPEQSREVLLEEYYRRHFGDAAVPMRRFFERCEQQWMRQPGRAYWLKHYRNESQAQVFPSTVCGELRGLLDEAARWARGDFAKRRVQQVSDAFGVTERFVVFCEARDALNRTVLAHETHSSDDQGLSAHQTHERHETRRVHRVRYEAARAEFIAYTKALMARQPGALAPFRWEDYLRHEPPAGNGERWTGDGGQWTADGERGAANGAGRAENLLRNGDLRGTLVRPRRIGGLDYGVAMPEGWMTTVEPAEGQRAGIEEGVLRLERNKETFVYQWLPTADGAPYRATVQVRGRVQPSAAASLTLSWLDERQTPLGFKVHRLPEGEWPEWVTLEVTQDLPMSARWIGTGVRVQHQLPGDWLEARQFRLERVR